MIPELRVAGGLPAQDVAAATADDGRPGHAGAGPGHVGTAPARRRAAPRARAGIRAHLGVLVGALGIVAVLAGSALFVAGFSLGRESALTPGTPSGAADAFQPFWDTYSAITDRYAGGAVDQKSLVEGAIKGMIGALDDPYSLYMTSDEFKASLQGIAGQFEGIGATIGTVDGAGETTTCATLGDGCRLAIVRPLTGSPAEKAGLMPGDVITAIDGTPLAGLTADAARTKVRGPKDTTVTLQIERGKGAAFDGPDRARGDRPAGGRDDDPRRRQGRATSSSTASRIVRRPTSTPRCRGRWSAARSRSSSTCAATRAGS